MKDFFPSYLTPHWSHICLIIANLLGLFKFLLLFFSDDYAFSIDVGCVNVVSYACLVAMSKCANKNYFKNDLKYLIIV